VLTDEISPSHTKTWSSRPVAAETSHGRLGRNLAFSMTAEFR
jgi:hypothetical protein